MQKNSKEFKQEIAEALRKDSLRSLLERRRSAWVAGRERWIHKEDFERLRAEAREVEERCIGKLPELIERFKVEAEAAGAVVYEAKTPEDANRYILEVAQKHGVKLAVKSKSMVSEETQLNPYLESAGIKVVETDVGEWIVQLAGERPSHIIAPSVHKTRQEVAALFSKEIGIELDPDDIHGMVEAARNYLRQSFINAQMGISGANIAIADSGTICVLTNEGNDKLATTLPPVHVAITTIDKIVESLDDATKLLNILSLNATNQKLATYTSFIRGPSRTGDIEFTLTMGAHGPKEVHIVLLDSGRRELAENPDFREVLYCIRCAACLYPCPVYQAVGGHVFGGRLVGGVGSLLMGLLYGMDETAHILDLCTGCMACNEVCATGMDVPGMIHQLKEEKTARQGLPLHKQVAYHGLLNHPGRMSLAAGLARAVQGPLAGRNGLLNSLPVPGLPDHIKLPSLAPKPFRDFALPAPADAGGPRVAIFSGCLIDYVYPDIGKSMSEVLARHGYRVSVPEGQGCCGFPAFQAGDRESAARLAKLNIDALAGAPAEYVVTGCPTCLEALKLNFPDLLDGDPEYEQRAKELAERCWDFSEFAADVLGIASTGEGGAEPQTEAPEDDRNKLTYHDPCHLRRGFGVYEQPRRIIRASSGTELVEMEDADVCCGFAGAYCADYPGIAGRMLDRKITHIEQTGAGAVVTACPGCVLHLRGGLAKKGSAVRVLHIAELLASRQ